jgi:hypothetical protein
MLNNFASTDGHRNLTDTGPARSATAGEAERLERRAVRASRWFAGYLAVIGLASAAWITLIETVFVDGFERALAGSAWAIVVLVAAYLAERQAVHPRGATRYQLVAGAIWLVAYLFAVGPFVRGVYGEQLLPWVIGSLVISLPFFVAAVLVLRR